MQTSPTIALGQTDRPNPHHDAESPKLTTQPLERDEYNGIILRPSPWLSITFYLRGCYPSNQSRQFPPDLPLFITR